MSELKTTRRSTLGRVAAALPLAAGLMAQTAVDEKSFRYRAETVDSVARRARDARTSQRVSLAEYHAMVQLLREEETQIHALAEAFQFQDLTESNYWRRGRLKFPSTLQTELRKLQEGYDPAK